MCRHPALSWLLAALLGCAGTGPPRADLEHGYALSGGERWSELRAGAAAATLRAAYPELFAVVLDPERSHDPDLRELRDDLEARPSGPHSYLALNAVAFAYFELNYRAQTDRGGPRYLADSFRAAKLVAIPWRAYGEIEDPTLRDAILDFFSDAASGLKEESATTAPRLLRVVESLARKEHDPRRSERIAGIVERLEASTAAQRLE